jgi:hypothetical protein
VATDKQDHLEEEQEINKITWRGAGDLQEHLKNE